MASYRGPAVNVPSAVRSNLEPGTSPPSTLAPPTWRVVLILALPVLLQQLLLLTVQLSDRFFAGHLHAIAPQVTGDPAAYQAAHTTANYLSWVISSYIVFVGVGSTALVARFTGAGDRALAIHTTNQSIVLAVVLGLAGSVAGWIFRHDLVALLQLEGDAAAFAAAYLVPMYLLMVFQMIEAAAIACLVGAGDTRTGLYIRAGVTLINVPLAWGLCHTYGFVGISLGTAVSHLIGGCAALVVLARGRFGLKLRLQQLWPDFALMRRLLRVSVPAGIDSLSVTLGQLWYLSLVNSLGDVASSAHGIALGWEALGFLSGNAFGIASMTLVGQNLGAGRPGQAARSGWIAFGLGCGIMCTMGLIFFTLAPRMFALYCPDANQQPIVEVGVPVLRLVAFAMPALASSIIFTAALRGAGDTRVPVLFTWIGFLCVRIPLAYALALPEVDLGPLGTVAAANMGLFGAWLAMFADLLVRGAFFLGRFSGGKWKTMRV
jgi:putative MATE family efflux protein